MSQTLEQRIAVRRANLDLHINLLAEQESTLSLRMLERICKKLGIEMESASPTLTQDTDPVELVRQVERQFLK